jgi:hypothetical protein
LGDTGDTAPAPLTQRELADRFGMSPERVGWLVRRAVARLLGDAPRPGGRDVATCAVCEATFFATLQQRKGGGPHVCGPACLAALRRRAQHARGLRRGRTHLTALQGLPLDAFAVLPTRERELVRAYYGLDGREPETQRALAKRLHIDTRRLGAMLADGVARLLGQDPAAAAAPPSPTGTPTRGRRP